MGAHGVAQALTAQESGTDLGAAVLVGLVGAGIGQSRTPLMHEREGARLGLRYIYRLLDSTKDGIAGRGIGEILDAARMCGFAGLNVTYPFKQAIIPYLDDLSENARRIGAVNTVVLRDGKAFGHNTDLWGFAEGFRRDMQDAALGTVLQLGAGGAGSAVARALVQMGVEDLVLADVDAGRATDLAAAINRDEGKERARAVPVAGLSADGLDGVVNTTPVGMRASPGMPVPEGFLDDRMWVCDIVYFPLETALLREARAVGCRRLSGASMAVYQAVRAFELFTGLTPDSEEMRATFDAFER
jgi:shikimate dehydrogenase